MNKLTLTVSGRSGAETNVGKNAAGRRIFSGLLSFLFLSSLMLIPPEASGDVLDEGMNYVVCLRDDTASARLLSDDCTMMSDVVVTDADTLCRYLREGLVDWYEPDYEAHLFDTEPLTVTPCEDDDLPPHYRAEDWWQLQMIAPDIPYSLGLMGEGVRVGVIDSGVTPHDEIIHAVIDEEGKCRGYNYLDENYDLSDGVGHGTFVTGVIAAADDGVGALGVAPSCEIVTLKCFDSNKSSPTSRLAVAIKDAVEVFHCDVINMSFGLAGDARVLREAVEYAASQGVILVAAAGNEGTTTLQYPAAYSSVIGVGAVTSSGTVWSKSQRNNSVFVTAPGGTVKGLSGTASYKTGSGTSYATPFVTGTAAMFRSYDPSMTLDRFRDALMASAVDKGVAGYDTVYGYGILNVIGCFDALLADAPIYLSEPVSEDDAAVSCFAYNSLDAWFDGTAYAAGYDERGAMTALDTASAALAPHTISRITGRPNGKTDHWFILPEETVPVSNVRELRSSADN